MAVEEAGPGPYRDGARRRRACHCHRRLRPVSTTTPSGRDCVAAAVRQAFPTVGSVPLTQPVAGQPSRWWPSSVHSCRTGIRQRTPGYLVPRLLRSADGRPGERDGGQPDDPAAGAVKVALAGERGRVGGTAGDGSVDGDGHRSGGPVDRLCRPSWRQSAPGLRRFHTVSEPEALSALSRRKVGAWP